MSANCLCGWALLRRDMRIDKYTQKTQEALQGAQDLASQARHPEDNERDISFLLFWTRARG